VQRLTQQLCFRSTHRRRHQEEDNAASLALAARLQAEENAAAAAPPAKRLCVAADGNWMHPFDDGSLADGIGFRLTRIAALPGAPAPRNDGAVCFEDLLRPDATTGGVRCALLGGSGFSFEWLLTRACPMLFTLPKVCIIWQEDDRPPGPGASVPIEGLPPNFEVFSPSL
jgi:hypothetical protein